MSTIGNRLKRLREQKEWTQKELEQKTGNRIAQGQISEYERDIVPPKLENLKILADVLGVSVAVIDETLLGDYSTKEKESPKCAITGFNKCPFGNSDGTTRDLLKAIIEMKPFERASLYSLYLKSQEEKKETMETKTAG